MIGECAVEHRRVVVIAEYIRCTPVGVKPGVNDIQRQGCHQFNYKHEVENLSRQMVYFKYFPFAYQINSKKNKGQGQRYFQHRFKDKILQV